MVYIALYWRAYEKIFAVILLSLLASTSFADFRIECFVTQSQISELSEGSTVVFSEAKDDFDFTYTLTALGLGYDNEIVSADPQNEIFDSIQYVLTTQNGAKINFHMHSGHVGRMELPASAKAANLECVYK